MGWVFDCWGYCIGAKHTGTTNVLKGLPQHLRGEGEKILKQLRTIGYVTFHPTSYGMEVSLNPAKIIGEYFKKDYEQGSKFPLANR
ncbi:MAG: hypothetical protein LBH79_03380 [Nitrososphaerota archaeon]|jgi:hypothetical protein|nr:hypothetical protein [Nitrososphaerota archaeon]